MSLKFSVLTRANMRQLKPSQSLHEHGIIFDRMEDGDGRFRVNLMVDGRRVHRVVGTESEGVTREKVESFIEKIKTEAREERLNLPKGRKTALTFREAGEKYITRLAEEGGKNIRVKHRQLEQHLYPALGSKPLAGITTSDLECYKKSRGGEQAAAATINRELAVVSHLFAKAIEWSWIDHRPAKINRIKENNARSAYLTQDQMDRLLEAARGDQNPQVYLFTKVGLESSMRKREILSIRLEHIDLDRHLIYLPHAKAGAREQPITKHLADVLREQLELAEPGQEWLFPSGKSKTGHTDCIDKAFRRSVKHAGMDPKEVVRHTLRHTAITHLIQAGVDLPTVQRISGHRTLVMVSRYAHQNGAHIQSALDKLEARYRSEPTSDPRGGHEKE